MKSCEEDASVRVVPLAVPLVMTQDVTLPKQLAPNAVSRTGWPPLPRTLCFGTSARSISSGPAALSLRLVQINRKSPVPQNKTGLWAAAIGKKEHYLGRYTCRTADGAQTFFLRSFLCTAGKFNLTLYTTIPDVTRVILKVFSVMFSARTALDYREQCFGGQAQNLIAARC